MLNRLRKKPLSLIGLGLIVFFALVALLAHAAGSHGSQRP